MRQWMNLFESEEFSLDYDPGEDAWVLTGPGIQSEMMGDPASTLLIYSFSSGENRAGDALKWLRDKCPNIGVSDPGQPGDSSYTFWQHMASKGLVDFAEDDHNEPIDLHEGVTSLGNTRVYRVRSAKHLNSLILLKGELRATVTDKDMYAWDAMEATHSDFLKAAGVTDGYRILISMTEDNLALVDFSSVNRGSPSDFVESPVVQKLMPELKAVSPYAWTIPVDMDAPLMESQQATEITRWVDTKGAMQYVRRDAMIGRVRHWLPKQISGLDKIYPKTGLSFAPADIKGSWNWHGQAGVCFVVARERLTNLACDINGQSVFEFSDVYQNYRMGFGGSEVEYARERAIRDSYEDPDEVFVIGDIRNLHAALIRIEIGKDVPEKVAKAVVEYGERFNVKVVRL